MVLPEAWVVKCAKCGCIVTCKAVDPQAEHADPHLRDLAPVGTPVVTCSCCWSACRYPAAQIFRDTPQPSQACSIQRAREQGRNAQRQTAADPKPKGALLIAASLIAAVRLHKDQIKPSPLVHSKIADSIALAEMILAKLNGKGASRADVPAYNIPGVSGELNFTPQALAGIFLGKIKKWNDPEIAKHNSGVKLPAADIAVVHRDDGSGTTYVWTDYLSKVSDEWKTKVGRGTSASWPVGQGRRGNEGVADAVKQTANSIGYVELIFAIQKQLNYGRVQNPSGVFVKAELSSVTAAATEASTSMPDDFRVSITNASGPNAYPISSFTWLLIPNKIQDERKKTAIVEFLHWMLTSGQDYAEPLNYSRLPRAVINKEMQAISRIE